MKTTQHTPLPSYYGTNGPTTATPYDVDPDGDIVKRHDVQNSDGTWGMQTEIIAKVYKPKNAQFIVTACNAHYELLEACKAIVEALDDPDNGKDRDFMAAVDWKQVRAAIAKAQGNE